MKALKKTFTLLLLLFSLIESYSQTRSSFYYSFAEKIHINKIPNHFVIEFVNSPNQLLLRNFNPNKISEKIYTVSGYIPLLNNRNQINQGDFFINPVYETIDGLKLYMKNSIILKWNPNISENQKNLLINRYHLIKIKSTRLYEIYKTTDNPLKTSQYVYESGLVNYCHPEFISKVEKHEYIPNDEYFINQFYLHNTGQQLNDNHFGTVDADIDAPESWDITKGSSSIITAIIDEGVTNNHPDLPSSRQIRLLGSNFNPDDGLSSNDPSPNNNGNHGNACAGIIAAEMDNNQGIAGIAPQSKIMPIKIPFGYYPAQTYADAITFASDNGANIISNSWGFGSSNSNLFPEVIVAINDAISNGSVIIFAAGNTANHASYNNGYVTFPANADIPLLLVVGASDRNDAQANYSPTSSNIDVSAPSHTAYNSQISGESFNIWTIDLPGSVGYNTWHDSSYSLPSLGEILPSSGTNHLAYTGRMGGTSAAAPEVAGVVALMLSVNPNLSVQQVNNIIHNSADQVGGYNYNFGHSQELGYGRLNAYKAVLMSFELETPDVVCYNTPTTLNLTNNPNISVSWQASPNINIVSSTNNSITFTALNPLPTGDYGWVKAILNNNLVLEKNFLIGTPISTADIDAAMLIDGEQEILVETVDEFGNGLEWRVNGILVNDNGNDWVNIVFSDYPCFDNQIILSIRKNGICG